ncbi:hypothetical protein [Pseudanabaena sp. FACHB-2040]|uniref:hypothetical protein n=1 Tax=Pseudanabaena sp. FACHB-2040 TaxID=2692859 RepID=UPI0016856CDC|nr:hypothetical protein [Pseudanabaena sp. FACHB-2040]MBD2261363.1 hypothetical protein [Pseudanabaena sp. FACHB-2040]
MDKSEVKAIVHEHINRLMNELGPVRSWNVTVKYDRLSSDAHTTINAEIGFDYAYEQAVITIDPDSQDDANHVLRNLRHELIHLLLAPIEAYRGVVRSMLDEQQEEVEAAAERVAIERCVMNVERVLDWGLKIPLMPEEAAPEQPQAAELKTPRKRSQS